MKPLVGHGSVTPPPARLETTAVRHAAAGALMKRRPPSVHLIGRTRPDAALYAPAPRYRGRGRPRARGPRLRPLGARAARKDAPWQRVQVTALGVQPLPNRDVCPQGPRERGSATGLSKSLVAQRVRKLSRAGGHARNLPTGRKKALGRVNRDNPVRCEDGYPLITSRPIHRGLPHPRERIGGRQALRALRAHATRVGASPAPEKKRKLDSSRELHRPRVPDPLSGRSELRLRG